jgi:hypothetical protein
LKNAAEKEHRIVDLERALKEVREAATAEKKRLEDELAEEKRKAVEATAQFNTMSTGRSILYADDPFFGRRSFSYVLTVASCRVP